jgi:hypothetical protein
MSDLKALLERADRAVADVPLPADGLEGLERRRDRKRRNQRIAAGVVGVAAFVAAIWIVTSVGSLDGSGTSVGPAGDVTGPTETGTDGDRTGGDPLGTTSVTSGACSDGAIWQRELTDLGHRIEMLFGVWKTPEGHSWRIVFRHVAPHREHVFFRGTEVAAGLDDGFRFEVAGRDRDWPGIERFQARAVDTQTGQVCTAKGGGRF